MNQLNINPQQEWENIYKSNSFHHKNEYPNNEIISFIINNYGHLKDKSLIKILDLGCGWGNNLKFLKDKGFDYYGIDFSQTAVKHCLKTFKNIVHGDISNLPYQSNFFDCVLDRMSIQHNPKEKIVKIFDEVHRVIKPRGVFFSILVAKANYGLFTTFFIKTAIKKLAKKFRQINIDTLVMYDQKNSVIAKSYQLTAQKCIN